MGLRKRWTERAARRAEEEAPRAQAEQDRLAEERRCAEEREAAEAAAVAQEAIKSERRRAESVENEWKAEDEHLRSLLQAAQSYVGAPEGVGGALQLRAGEHSLFVLETAQLIEPRKERGTYVGGSPGYTIPGERPHHVGAYSGFSFRIAKGVRFNVGGSRGSLVGGTPSIRVPAVRPDYVPGEEVPTAIDSGTVTITDQRVVFQGDKQAREWPFGKLLGFESRGEWTSFQSSGRQKVSGVGYGPENCRQWEFMLGLAFARFDGSLPTFVAGLRGELAAHRHLRPPSLQGPEPSEEVERGDHRAYVDLVGELPSEAFGSSRGAVEDHVSSAPAPARRRAVSAKPDASSKPASTAGWWTPERVSDLMGRISPRAEDAMAFIVARAPEVPFDEVLAHLGLGGRATGAVMKSVGTALREMDAPDVLRRDYRRRVYQIDVAVAEMVIRARSEAAGTAAVALRAHRTEE